MKEIVDIFSAMLTPVIAMVVAYIACQQYKLNRSSLRNQLYERRLRVFKAVMSYLVDTVKGAKTSFQRVSRFYAESAEAEFLFKDDIPKKIDVLYKKGNELAAFEGLTPGERATRAKEQTDLIKWFYQEIEETKNLFRKYMQAD